MTTTMTGIYCLLACVVDAARLELNRLAFKAAPAPVAAGDMVHLHDHYYPGKVTAIAPDGLLLVETLFMLDGPWSCYYDLRQVRPAPGVRMPG